MSINGKDKSVGQKEEQRHFNINEDISKSSECLQTINISDVVEDEGNKCQQSVERRQSQTSETLGINLDTDVEEVTYIFLTSAKK